MKEMVSVIVPAYNRQEYIKECLESVLAQTYENLEIMVIDDGSTDQTAEICRDMAQADPRIQLLAGEHKGVSAARNVGLERAKGEYVLFVDSDDIIHPRMVETLVRNMQKYNAQMGGTMGTFVSMDRWPHIREKMLNSTSSEMIEHHEFADALKIMFTCRSAFSVIGGVIMRRDWIGETKFCSDLTIGEDFYFIYENLTKGASVVFLNNRWYLNRDHQTNTSWDYSYTGFMTRFRRRELVWQNEEKCGRKAYAKLQKNEILGIYLQCLKNNRPYGKECKKMRKTLRKYQKTLIKVMKLKTKFVFLAVVYLPFTGVIVNRVKK